MLTKFRCPHCKEITEVKVFTLEEVADLFIKLLDNPPCDYGKMDERVNDDSFCSENCNKGDFKKCWEHAIEAGWIR